MSALGELVAAVWRDGLGPDDTSWLAASAGAPGDPDRAMFGVFAAWSRLLSDEPIDVPPAPADEAGRVVHAAAVVVAATLRSQLAELEAALEVLEQLLEHLPEDHAHAAAAHAWADLALARVAVRMGDVAAARRRYEAIAAPGRPVALRITAMLALASLAMERVNVEPARNWARKANALAEASGRNLHAVRARLLWGLLDYASGDLPAMRKTLGTMIERGEGGAVARLLLANAEKGARAMQLLADGLRDAVEHRDPLAYVLCVLVGARRYAGMGRDADALVTITAGIVELGKVAPVLAKVLIDERDEWKRSWADNRYSRAERAAIALLDANH